ncbi:thioesterase domain-containing protein [Streptomyces sp. NPDC003077]|uniref:thioesterase II family protein n=1 Tax=Streptomyces sp. NPDC003077 TaxID=3154443 RepID=UPI0033A218A9
MRDDEREAHPAHDDTEARKTGTEAEVDADRRSVPARRAETADGRRRNARTVRHLHGVPGQPDASSTPDATGTPDSSDAPDSSGAPSGPGPRPAGPARTPVPHGDTLWIRRFHPSPDSRARLVCLPHAGGSASYFHRISDVLQPSVEVLAVQYPGRQDRSHEPGVESVPELAEHVVSAAEPWLDAGPVAFFGHSLGAGVAFEAVRLLEHRRGIRPMSLVVSGRRAPSKVRQEAVHRLDDDAFLAEVRRLRGMDERVGREEELLRLLLPALRSDYKAAETYVYRPGPKLSCPVMALSGADDPTVRLAEMAAWRRHTTGPFWLRTYPGGHYYLNDLARDVGNDIADHLLVLRARRDAGPTGRPPGPYGAL